MDHIIPTKNKAEKFMRMVYDWASLSKDPRTKIGAVLVKENVPISNGYNNFPRKVIDFTSRYLDKQEKYKFIIHGEANCILNAARLGYATQGATLYTQGIPCNECAKAIINAGIIKIVYHVQWPNLTYSPEWLTSIKYSDIMFKEAGVEIGWYDGILGVTGFLDGKELSL